MQFAADLKNSGLLAEGLQHQYVWGLPGDTPAQEAIDDMLSSDWDDATAVGSQPARGDGTAEFHPYPFVYEKVLAPLVAQGVPYRMTEANDCLHGVPGASNGFASALWALDYMHWWAAHHMAGVNFHNNPWLPTDTIVPDPAPCTAQGCTNYRVTPKAYGIKAFDLGSHGSVEPVAIANPQKINLTAYAVGTSHDLYVTIINKTHSMTHDAMDAAVVIEAAGFNDAIVDAMVLTDGEPGNAALSTVTLGGDTISNMRPGLASGCPWAMGTTGNSRSPWQSTTAVVVRIRTGAASTLARNKEHPSPPEWLELVLLQETRRVFYISPLRLP